MHSCKQVETPLASSIGWILATFASYFIFWFGEKDGVKPLIYWQHKNISWITGFLENRLYESPVWTVVVWLVQIPWKFYHVPPWIFFFPSHKQMKPLVQSSRNHVSMKQIKSLKRMNIEGEEWRIDDLLTVVILHLELSTACDIITLQIAIYKQLRKYDLCITIGLTKPSAYYKQLPPAYFPVGCRKEGMHITRELDAV